ncbi:ABC transporter ATP-binding protein [Candidatus Acetothermia bacterium]|nr:ABC transporter ATP-binding protein [Candidatus Acetothermia bacterium]MCI2428118.1 ABC transporter ATP-binding protein [Candidatus Acetothermia bacterium]
MRPVITVKDLTKKYGSLRAVDGVSFAVYENEIFGIVGPNGAGKTTTVECLEGLRVPSSGSIRVLGLEPKADGYKLRQLIGIQLQEGKFPDRIKVKEALELFASFYSRSVPAGHLLEKVGLLDKADDYFDNLSGGQKQRLSIALALVNDPQVVFFDELTTGLDPQARRAMWGMVRSTREAGKTVILVTHFMEEAERLCDRVAIVDQGKIVALDTPATLIRSIEGSLRINFSVNDSGIAAQLESIAGCRLAVSNRDITIQCTDYRVVGEVIRILGENDCDFHDFTVSKPALEDVFLSITGKEMRE